MTEIKGKVGPFELIWKSVPRGLSGTAYVEVSGKLMEVRWRRDPDGLWLELPHGIVGFEVQAEATEEGHLQYRLETRGKATAWSGLSFSRAGEDAAAAARAGVKKGTRVRAQMPGKIIRILAKAGMSVEKDQPLLVMEAMKMENEIRAAQAGKITQLKVSEGQAVESGADLCVIEPV